jgi:16S rRNA (guanine527-N7)-methyltransferase
MPSMNDLEMGKKVFRACRAHGIELGDEQREMLEEYARLLIEWNRKMNLVSRKDEENIWFSHILHSLTPLFYVSIPEGVKVLDLGTGGGLPGIPLAIVRKDLRFTLLDSIRKKTAAVGDMVQRLGLRNADVVCSRAEDLGKRDFDIVVVRAVAPLVELITWTRGLTGVRKEWGGGLRAVRTPFMVALKGGDLKGEIEAARVKVGAKGIDVVHIGFDGSEELGLAEKKLVIVEL